MKRTLLKIKAFTLTEVMVVIVISTIVAGLAFTVLGVVQGNLRNIEDNYEYKTQIQALETAFTIDFNTFPHITWDPRENSIHMSSPLSERKYKLFTDSIVTDVETHVLKIKEKTFYYEGEEVNAGAIDAIRFTFYKTREPHQLFVYKYNDPTIHF